jgi:hypothetical protein
VKDIGTAQISAIRQAVLKLVYSIVSEGKLVTGTLMIHKAKSFHNKMKTIDECTFSDGSKKKFLVRIQVSGGSVKIWNV